MDQKHSIVDPIDLSSAKPMLAIHSSSSMQESMSMVLLVLHPMYLD